MHDSFFSSRWTLEEALEVNVFHYSAVISACEDDWRLSLELLDGRNDETKGFEIVGFEVQHS